MQLKRTAWLESMLVRPQHFQQQEHYLERSIHDKFIMMNPFMCGFYKISFDPEALAQNKFILQECHGVFPDGTWFKYDCIYDSPITLELKQGSKIKYIYLCIAMALGSNYVDSIGQPRYSLEVHEVKDSLSSGGSAQEITVAELNLHLATNNEELNNYYYMPVAEIEAVIENKGIVLADNFIPPCLNIFAHYRTRHLFNSIENMLKQKQRLLRNQMENFDSNQISLSTTDGLILQIINRATAMMSHWQHTQHVHPEKFYEFLLMLLAEFSTYMTASRQLDNILQYHHMELQKTLMPMYKVLSELLNAQLDAQAMEISLKLSESGLYTALLADNQFMRSGRYILQANLGVSTEQIKSELKNQIKIAGASQIEKIINLQLPGIPLKVLAKAPAMLFHDEKACYFELQTNSIHWQNILISQALCIYLTKDYPNLTIKLWFIPMLFSDSNKVVKSENYKKEELINA